MITKNLKDIMTIEVETLFQEKTILTEIFEKNPSREYALKNCFEKVIQFYSKHFDHCHLLLLNVTIPNTRVHRYKGIWRLLNEEYEFTLPVGIQSDRSIEKDGELIYACKIETSFDQMDHCFEVLDQYRKSLLIFGKFSNETFNQVLEKAKDIDYSNVNTWKNLIEFISKKDLIGIRLYNEHHTLENGVFVYEPVSFFEKHGKWDSRN